MDRLFNKCVCGAFLHVRQGIDESAIADFSVGLLNAIESAWNTMDVNIDNKEARRWNLSSSMREKEKLQSRLIGPESIISYGQANFLIYT